MNAIKSIQIIITSLNNRETNERLTNWRRITKSSNQSIYKIKIQCIKIMNGNLPWNFTKKTKIGIIVLGKLFPLSICIS